MMAAASRPAEKTSARRICRAVRVSPLESMRVWSGRCLSAGLAEVMTALVTFMRESF